MVDQIITGQGGLELYNTTFRLLPISKGVDKSWYQVAVDLKFQGNLNERNKLLVSIAKKVAASTLKKIIVEIMESHYALRKTFALV